MSRRAALLLALGLLADPLKAQSPDSTTLLRALIARVESQMGAQERVRQDERRRDPPRPGRLHIEGRLAVVVPPGHSLDTIGIALRAADSTLRHFGVIPAGFLESIVQVMPGNYDTAATLAAASVGQRHRLTFEGRGAQGLSWPVIEPIATAFIQTLDPAWRYWLPRDFGITWDAETDGEGAIDDLASVSGYAAGSGCLTGSRRACRLWLGLTDEHDAYETRYRPEEVVAASRNLSSRTPDGEACRGGDATACLRVIRLSGWSPLGTIPAPNDARAGLIREVRERHGAEAVQRAFADSLGTIGQRLSRATGLSEDSVVGEWRTWVLSRGHTERVSAGIGDFGSALAFAVLLVAMATRSGRWR